MGPSRSAIDEPRFPKVDRESPVQEAQSVTKNQPLTIDTTPTTNRNSASTAAAVAGKFAISNHKLGGENATGCQLALVPSPRNTINAQRGPSIALRENGNTTYNANNPIELERPVEDVPSSNCGLKRHTGPLGRMLLCVVVFGPSHRGRTLSLFNCSPPLRLGITPRYG